MGRTLSGKNALAAQQQFDYEKNQVVLEMLNQFKVILETLSDEDGYISKRSLVNVLIQIKKISKEKAKIFFEDVKKMSKDELCALIDEAREIVKEVKQTTTEKQLIKSRINTKRNILDKEKELEPMFAKHAGQKIDTAQIFENLAAGNIDQDVILSI